MSHACYYKGRPEKLVQVTFDIWGRAMVINGSQST